MPLSQHVYCVAVAFKMTERGPSRVVQLVRASGYAKVASSIPSQGTYKNQSMNAQISGTIS